MLTGSSEIFLDAQLRDMSANGWEVHPLNATRQVVSDPVMDKMFDGEFGPSDAVKHVGPTPASLFFFFLPKHLSRHIAHHTNLYWRQTLDARVDAAYRREVTTASGEPRTKDKIRSNLKRFELVRPHKVVQWIGLMTVHSLKPDQTSREALVYASRRRVPGGDV